MFSINPIVSVFAITGISFLCQAQEKSVLEPELSGQVNFEYRQFFKEGNDSQDKEQPSAVMKPELYWSFNDDNSSITFTPFYRYDHMDSERTHADIRELKYLTYWDDYELRVGINKVFWGVTESEHLVDVINQTDSIESVDGEDKLGQPMIQFTAIKDWGVTEFYLLPYFRERTFPGSKGRLRTTIPINTDKAQYESSDKQKHIDYAARYSNTLGEWDIGVSYLHGTDREPYLISQGAELIPYYAQMKHAGVDIQGTMGSWLWKLEAVYKDSYKNYTSTDSGFEYTLVGVFNTVWDLGLLSEYLYDSRGEDSLAIGQNDVFAAFRLSLNDEDSTEMLFGMTQDLDNSDVRLYKLEASTRLTNELSLSIDAWASENRTTTDPLYSIRNDDFIQMAIEYYF
ncbi:hypothetical protein [Vibrio salinus]|uniref:hypothetical protein n=1 Tax=Vibrio salinus TaxID=2899784 RepID=UPI001E39862B|nr:hypothetical protein [Vibrio salinus]MCE0493288.1 hypothetical protein [Vibrio salinus]